LETLADIGAYLRIFDDEAYDLSPEAQAIVADPEAREVIATLLDLLADPGAAAGDDRGAPARKRAAAAYAAGAGEEAGLADEDKDAVTPSLYHDLMERLAERTGRRGKRLFLPLRAALTGRTKGPEMDRCLTVLGRASIRRRLERALKAAGVAGAQR
ncbi:MAG TPA: hypothetical protein PKV74_02990, partial [Syntrophales bacterium]|nr:hypothetical protein [Syntrophales bacterium]